MAKAKADDELTPEELERRYYRRFRTGFTYKEVSDMLWSYDEDPRTWHISNAVGKKVPSKSPRREGKMKKVGTRRHSILGKWREIKLEMWNRVLADCGGLQKYIEWVQLCKAQEREAA